MFERYDDTARRVIFYARLATERFKGESIEPEHILWGLLHVADSLVQQLAVDGAAVKEMIEGRLGPIKQAATTVEIPLSKQSMEILATAASESERWKHSRIGAVHLLFGVFDQTDTFAHSALATHGLSSERLREELAKQN